MAIQTVLNISDDTGSDGSDIGNWPSRGRVRVIRGEVGRVAQRPPNKNAALLREREGDPDPQVRPGSVETAPVRGIGLPAGHVPDDGGDEV